MNEPNVNSTPSGSAWAWNDESEMNDNPPTFETVVWNGYSPSTGEYSAVSAKWTLDVHNKLLHLEHVTIKYPYQPWNETLANPRIHISDKHKRIAQAVARDYFGMKKFKSRTRMYPLGG
jgi:hypothetical protein